jgi:hypothetical protein
MVLCSILAIIWFFLVLKWDVNTDFKKWKENKPIKHTKEGIIRALLLLPSVVLLTLPDFTIWKLLAAASLEASVWWELFDGLYNKKRGFKWRFNGSQEPDDSRLDKFLYHLSDSKETLLKWGLIILSLCGYIVSIFA